MIKQNVSSMKTKVKKKGFEFKQFIIEQENCAMKVGTDGVLLGAWINLNDKKKVLDIGTGTGLLALMCAQRLQRIQKDFHISAIEKDEKAFYQAQENIIQTSWKDNIEIYHQDIQDFAKNHCQQNKQKFDCILSNPPYFPACVPCKNKERDLARYTEQSHFQWLEWANTCLTESGQIHFVLPFEAGINLLKESTLYCIRRCDVVTKVGKSPTRMLLTFSPKKTALTIEELTIYNEQNQYTPEFIALTKEFYLKM